MDLKNQSHNHKSNSRNHRKLHHNVPMEVNPSPHTCTGLLIHLFPVSRLLTFCALAETRDIHYAHRIFSQISKPSIYIWNTMIRGYWKVKFPKLGMSLFCEMVRGNVEKDHNSSVFGHKLIISCFTFVRTIMVEAMRRNCLMKVM
ncbi:Pentatricopeptide repeat [Dillenia turbinata]|uniref:Pentatricopeptide repeat n=1 Tax=Dillenia turbinata TaxID=194707 RepID=A0AAN8ZW40_9MAGN